jgi:tetratricopeptide (TPR) repeat protein
MKIPRFIQKSCLLLAMSLLLLPAAFFPAIGHARPGDQDNDPELAARYLDLGPGDELIPGWSLVGSNREPQRIRIRFNTPGGTVLPVLLEPRSDEQPAFATTDSFRISYQGDNSLVEADKAGLVLFMQALVERVTARDTHGNPFPTPPVSGHQVESEKPSQGLVVGTSFALLVLATLALVLCFWWSGSTLRTWPARERWILFGLLFAGLLIRLLVVPHRLVKLGMFFPMMDGAITLDSLPRYGAGGPTLYHALFQLFPVHVQTVLYAHSIISIIGAWFATLLVRDLMQAGKYSLFVTAILMFTPIWLRDANSESLLVPALALLFAGLYGIRAGTARWRGWGAMVAVPLLALTMHIRPEFIWLTPVLFVITYATPGIRRSRPVIAAVAAVLLVAAVPGIYYLATVIPGEVAKGDILWSRLHPVKVLDSLITMNLLFQARFFPLGLTALVLIGIVLSVWRDRERRVVTLLLFLIALAWLAFYAIDMNEDSMLRLHLGPATLLLFIAARGLVILEALLAGKRTALVVLPAALLIWVGSGIPTAFSAFQMTNSVAQEELFERAVAHLPDHSVTLLLLTSEDQPSVVWSEASMHKALPERDACAAVHRQYPQYLVKPPNRQDRILSLSQFAGLPPSDGPTYFFLSSACYAIRDAGGEEHWEVAPAPYRAIHPACRWLLTNYEVEPLYLEWMPNYGELGKPFWWIPESVPGMPVGLVRVSAVGRTRKPLDTFYHLAGTYRSQALPYLEEKRYDEALAAVLEGIEVLRDSPAMWEKAASMYYFIGAETNSRENIEKSLDYWYRIAERDIHYTDLLSIVGSVFAVYRMHLEEEGAGQYLEARLAEDPDNVLFLYLMGQHYFYMKHSFTIALEYFTTVCKTVPHDPRVYLYRALSHFYLGRQEEAERLIELGIKHANESDPDLYYGRSIIVRLKNLDLAVEDIERYLDMSQGPDKVQLPAKQKWLRKELDSIKEGNPSSWWRAKRPTEPWKDHPEQ